MLTQELRALSHDNYLELSRKLYTGLLALLEGVTEHIRLFNDPEGRDTR